MDPFIERETDNISLAVTAAGKVNLALQQNAVPILRELAVENVGEEVLTELKLVLESEPAFLQPREWLFDRLIAGTKFHVTDANVDLSTSFLTNLKEAIAGELRFTLSDSSGVLVAQKTSIEVLAKDEWGGADEIPEIIAAFVTPNDSGVATILRSASKILRSASLAGSFDGYQSGSPRRVAEVIAGIWSAIARLELSYAVPPASFEKVGQKIRSPARVLEEGLGSCLDLCVLFASCLEQAGLHPVIVFQKDHAFAGCWLQDEDFSHAFVDDLQVVRKRVDLNELLVFEPTMVANSPPVRFPPAVQGAKDKLKAEDDFYLAVDIARCRNARIRPLATVAETAPDSKSGVFEPDSDSAVFEVPSDIPSVVEYEKTKEEPAVPADSPEARLEKWKRKLLDLSLRNRLLNFRAVKRTIPIECPNPPQLEDLLADGKVFQFRPAPEIEAERDPRSQELHWQQRHEDLYKEEALKSMARGELFVKRDQAKLQASLIDLYRTAKGALEEGGTNILYLAVGFLHWNQTANPDRIIKAPLILIPVQLTRRSVRSGFRLSSTDEDSRFNPTLLELLSKDFGLELPALRGDLPTDAHGLDVTGILQLVQRGIRDIQGWEVVPDVVLSTFSFAKHLMWQDLVARSDELKSNPVVRHLIETPREPYQGAGEFPDPRQLDDTRSPLQTFCPLPADSSQLSAIIAGAEGKDFVLFGPPGTGKSQTISNMIAQCLAENRTVLFVSEKTAALDVVYRRLQNVGIGEFCLELHSNKARKSDVLQQLGAAWEATGEFDSDEWRREGERLRVLRDQLNAYVRALHKVHPNRWSAYRAMGEVIANDDVPAVSITWPNPDCHSADDYDRLLQTVRRIDARVAQIGSVADNPLREIRQTDWTARWQAELLDTARKTGVSAARLAAKTNDYIGGIGFPDVAYSLRQLGVIAEIHKHLLAAYQKNYGITFGGSGDALLSDIKHSYEHLRQFAKSIQNTSASYRWKAIELPLDDLSQTWEASLEKWWLGRWVAQRSVRKTLQGAISGGSKPDDIAGDLEELQKARDHAESVESMSHLGQALGRTWQGLKTKPTELLEIINWSDTTQSAVRDLCANTDEFIEFHQALGRLLNDGNSLLGEGGPISRTGSGFTHALLEHKDDYSRMATLASGKDQILLDKEKRGYLEGIQSICRRWIRAENRIRYWSAWREVRQQAAQQNLAPLVQAMESPGSSAYSAEKLFVTNYARWWLNALVDREDPLRKFVPAEHDQCIKEFRDLDDDFRCLTQKFIRAKLAGEIPDIDDVSRDPEWSVLSRELQKKRRHMPLRQLISKMPNTLTRLTPCVMMSPLSVAQYLATDTRPFDVVIFDEASQIPVWDAIGAIARGKQCVIVGDPKQLPPTTFFERRDDEDIDEDVEIEDLESILDECIGASLPTLQLNWHYRSLSESLIAFSNSRYYGGRLITFPPPAIEDKAVRFHHVDGVYERGGARINKNEGKAIVDDVVRRLQTPGWDDSIGIVTFNVEQQTYIQDLLDNERRKRPELEYFFSDDTLEPVFVKNLESVQGDERSIIFFSVTYGPDITGRTTMNFGPLNQEGGERRLNVAITRARKEMHVYSTLRPEQINLSRTRAEGVRDLKHFMEFAQRGPRALAEAVFGSQGDFDSPFEAEVAAALQQKGWQVHPQVGVSAFKIDLGVVHPDMPGRYLAGIECDGATYHRSATARDRDYLREQVLRDLGWDILRIWSTDWWTDRDSTLNKVHSNLEELLELRRKELDHIDEVEDDAGAYQLVASRVEASDSSGREDDRVEAISVDLDFPVESTDSEPIPAHAIEYREADLGSFEGHLDPDRFETVDYTQTLRNVVDLIIEAEAPIRIDVLAQRVARAHGFQRTGAKILRRVEAVVGRRHKKTREGNSTFVWRRGSNPGDWSDFRTSEGPTSVDQVPIQELMAMARHVMAHGQDGEAAVRQMATMLGLSRIRHAAKVRLMVALRKAAQ